VTGTSHILATGHACTPSACTWGEVGKEYTSQGFVVGLIALIVLFLVLRALARAGRRQR
jgi:hypothetical protein